MMVAGGINASIRGIIYVCAFAYEDSEPTRALPTSTVGEIEKKNQLQVTFQALGMGHVDDTFLEAVDYRFNPSKCVFLFGKHCYSQPHLSQPSGMKPLGKSRRSISH